MTSEDEAAAEAGVAEAKAEGPAEVTEGAGEAGRQGLPPLDFSTFVLSLSSSVLMNLGVVENPVTKKVEKEPAVARQTIDLLDLLKEKTRGNLSEAEGKLLDDVLHELRIWYCKVTDKKPAGKAGA